jgi:demethylmenaquinone methyltransferase/2-methoxy-6-polyprenyl-1,4-benzoquinol methylase
VSARRHTVVTPSDPVTEASRRYTSEGQSPGQVPSGHGSGTVPVKEGRLEPDAVETMFDRIAPVYDVMNRVMTAGLDQRWRRLAAGSAVHPGDRVLDACCGTGDLAVAGQRLGGRVTGLDFSERMLERARRKSDSIDWVRGDLLELPFPDGAFDSATVGFGVRNVGDLALALQELRRVLRPAGRLAILEITTPRGILRPFYKLWFDGVIPLLGKLLPGGSAYTYLPASVRRFPGPDDLAAMMERAGFACVDYRLLAGGIVALHRGTAR